MQINQIIMYIMAFGALLGGMDRIFGNRFGFGERFEEAFRLMGPVGLSMAGIICLAPLLSDLLGAVVVPISDALGFDPAMFGALLPIDMGGYQLATDLARDPEVGKFAGIIVSATFGCTIIFVIPVGMGTIQEADRPYFTRGILLGLVSLPAALVTGGFCSGLTAEKIIWNSLPILVISIVLFIGLVKAPNAVARGFRGFSKGIQALAILGLMLGAIQYMTGSEILKGMTPLEEAMDVVCSICIVMLGSLPLAELMKRALKSPFKWIGIRTGLNATSTTGLLIGIVSIVPALVMIPNMDKRGKIVNGSFAVCAASAFAAHLGFAMSTEPNMVAALLVAKLVGGLLGILIAMIATHKEHSLPQMNQSKFQDAP